MHLFTGQSMKRFPLLSSFFNIGKVKVCAI